MATTRNVTGNRSLLPCLSPYGSAGAATPERPSCSRAATENVRHKLFCGSTSPPFGHLSCPRRGKAYQPPAGVTAIMLLLREPEGCDSQPGASPWARAARILPAAMSIPGRQARYSFPPRHSFRALQWAARKRSPQATRRIPHFFGSRRAAIRSRERALGHGPQGFCLLRCRSPGGRPGIAFRRATAFVPFSGRRESAARRRRGGYVASSASVGHRCPAAMLLRGHSGTGKMRLPQGQAHFSYFILFLRREGTPFNPREPAHRRKSSSPATG